MAYVASPGSCAGEQDACCRSGVSIRLYDNVLMRRAGAEGSEVMAIRTGTAKRLWALEGGLLTETRGNLAVGESGTVVIPCPSFLIEHSRGLVLIDTGLVPAACEDPRAVYGELADELSISLSREQCIDRQIEALGYKLEERHGRRHIPHALGSHGWHVPVPACAVLRHERRVTVCLLAAAVQPPVSPRGYRADARLRLESNRRRGTGSVR